MKEISIHDGIEIMITYNTDFPIISIQINVYLTDKQNIAYFLYGISTEL